MLTLAFRAAVPGLLATLNATLPFPVPLAPAVIVIHAAVVAAVHPQPAGAVTEKELAPPADPMDRLVGDTS